LPQPFWIPFHELLHSDVLSSGEKWSGAAWMGLDGMG
jgi:hypothetical protein